MTRARAGLVVLLAAIGAFLSWQLLAAHHGEGTAVAALCGDTSAGPSGCDVVNRSAYASVRGVPLAAVGLAFYLSLALLVLLGGLGGEAAAGASFVAFVALLLALGVDAVLLGIQALSLKAFCKLCLSTYLLNVLALLALWPARRFAARASALLRAPAGRVVVAAWLAGSAAFAALSLSLEVAYAAREAQRNTTLLGGPAPAAPLGASTAPSTPGLGSAAPASEVERYRQEAARLQAILDDSQKLEQYFADKAAHEYATEAIQNIDLKDVPMKGPAHAPVTAVTYSDFLCPFCRNLALGLEDFLPKSGDRLNIYFKNYPLEQSCNAKLSRTVHAGACVMALGGICANQQGKFWAYHDKVFAAPPANPGVADVLRIGQQAGLDAAALGVCLSSQDTKDKLARQIADATAAGVEATPTIFINGKKLPRVNDFIQVVVDEAAKRGIPPPTPPPAPGH